MAKFIGKVGAMRLYKHDDKQGITTYSVKFGCLVVVRKVLYDDLKPEYQLAVARVRLNKG